VVGLPVDLGDRGDDRQFHGHTGGNFVFDRRQQLGDRHDLRRKCLLDRNRHQHGWSDELGRNDKRCLLHIDIDWRNHDRMGAASDDARGGRGIWLRVA
jgi:hypothetical protein